jgi:hypothetical protein
LAPLAVLQGINFSPLCRLNALKKGAFHGLLTRDRSAWLIEVLTNTTLVDPFILWFAFHSHIFLPFYVAQVLLHPLLLALQEIWFPEFFFKFSNSCTPGSQIRLLHPFIIYSEDSCHRLPSIHHIPFSCAKCDYRLNSVWLFSGKKLIALVQMGSGKTCAFTLPILQELLENHDVQHSFFACI